MNSHKYEKLAILVQFIGPLILFGRILVKGEVLFWGTTYLQFTPWRWLAWNQIVHGEFPIWNPLNGLGAPLLANYQSALLYPPNSLLWIGAWLAGISGIAVMQTVIVIIHLIGSGIGFVFLTRSLKFKPFVQAIAGISYALCAYQVSRVSFLSINAVLVWIPWILFASINWIQSVSTRRYKTALNYILLHILFLVFQLLAGHAQIAWYTQLYAAVWVVSWGIFFGGRKGLLKIIGWFVTISMIGVMISMIQLLPTFELLSVSQRSSEVGLEYALNYSFWPWRFLNLLSPNLFGNPGIGNYWVAADNYWENAIYFGILPLLFSLMAIFRGRKNGRNSNIHRATLWFSFGMIIASIPLMLGKYSLVFPWLYHYIPTFDLFQAPSRFSIWFVISSILLAGCGLNGWQPPQKKALYWSRLGFAGSAGAIFFSILASIYLRYIVNQTYLVGILETSILLFVAFALHLFQPIECNKRKIWKGLVIALVITDLLYAGWLLNPSIKTNVIEEYGTLTARTGGRIYVSLLDEQAIKFQKYFKFSSFIPEDGWMGLSDHFLPNNNLLGLQPAINNFDPLVPARYQDFLSMLETVSKPERDRVLSWLDVNIVEEVSTDRLALSIRKLSPQGRYTWVGCVQPATDQNSAIELTEKWMQETDLSAYGVVESSGIPELTCNAETATIEVIHENSISQEIQVKNNQPGWFVQKDAFYPGWRVIIDGQVGEIVPFNYFLRGIYLLPGDHTIRIEYAPLSIQVGLIVSIVALAITIGVYIVLRRRLWDVD